MRYALTKPGGGQNPGIWKYLEMRRGGAVLGVSGIRELARRLGIPRTPVDRLFDLNHHSRLDHIEAAFGALGKPLAWPYTTRHSRARPPCRCACEARPRPVFHILLQRTAHSASAAARMSSRPALESVAKCHPSPSSDRAHRQYIPNWTGFRTPAHSPPPRAVYSSIRAICLESAVWGL